MGRVFFFGVSLYDIILKDGKHPIILFIRWYRIHIYEWERSGDHLHRPPIKVATYGVGIANLKTGSVFENRFYENLTNRPRGNYASHKSCILRAVTSVKGGKIADNRGPGAA